MSHLVCSIYLSNHTYTQPFLRLDFVRDNPGELVAEDTFTHSHLLCLSVIPYLLPPSIIIHGILPPQFTCHTVFFHNRCPSFLCQSVYLLAWHLHFILHIGGCPAEVDQRKLGRRLWKKTVRHLLIMID